MKIKIIQVFTQSKSVISDFCWAVISFNILCDFRLDNMGMHSDKSYRLMIRRAGHFNTVGRPAMFHSAVAAAAAAFAVVNVTMC